MILKEIAEIGKVSVARAHQWVAKGCPKTSAAEVESWIKTHLPERALSLGFADHAPRAPGRPAAGDLVSRLESVEQRCHRFIESSDSPALTSHWIKSHGHAVRSLMAARRAALEERLREGELIEVATLKIRLAEFDGSIIALLGAMPRSLASRIAPAAPNPVEDVLREWANGLMKMMSSGSVFGAAEEENSSRQA